MVPWTCESGGFENCRSEYLTDCQDVEGGVTCQGCLEGAEPVRAPRDDFCKGLKEIIENILREFVKIHFKKLYGFLILIQK